MDTGALGSPCPSPLILKGTVFSVQYSRSVMSNSLWPRGLQHTRLPCPSPTPRAYSNSCPSSWLWHPIISSSVVPFASCLQSFPASGSFPMNQFFASGAKVLEFQFSPSNEYSGLISFRIDWFDFLAVQGTLKSLLQLHSSKASILQRFPVAQTIKNLSVMQETRVWFLGWEDPRIAIHSSILAWIIPRTEKPGGLQFMGSKESDMTQWLTDTHSFLYSPIHMWPLEKP